MKLKQFKIDKKPFSKFKILSKSIQNAVMVLCEFKIRNSNYERNLGSSFQMVLHYNSQLRKSIFAWAAALERVRDQPNLNFKSLPNLPLLSALSAVISSLMKRILNIFLLEGHSFRTKLPNNRQLQTVEGMGLSGITIWVHSTLHI